MRTAEINSCLAAKIIELALALDALVSMKKRPTYLSLPFRVKL